jgi:hypothetical protein
VKLSSYKVSIRIEVSEDPQGYRSPGVSTVVERIITLPLTDNGLMGIARAIDPIVTAAESVGRPVAYQ